MSLANFSRQEICRDGMTNGTLNGKSKNVRVENWLLACLVRMIIKLPNCGLMLSLNGMFCWYGSANYSKSKKFLLACLVTQTQHNDVHWIKLFIYIHYTYPFHFQITKFFIEFLFPISFQVSEFIDNFFFFLLIQTSLFVSIKKRNKNWYK